MIPPVGHLAERASGGASPHGAATDPLPAWLCTAVALGLSALLGFALTGMPLAMLGVFHPVPVAAGTLALGGVLFVRWSRAAPADRSPASPALRRVLALLAIFVLAATAVNLRYSSQHLLTERDPGVYVNVGWWLADTGGLLVDTDREAFAGADDVSFSAGGFYEGYREDGRLYPQFLHLFPALLAVGAWIGDAWLLVRMNALVGGAALVVIFAFAARMMRPWFALGATIALAVNLTQVHFSRDAYTEILTQIFVFGGLWMLWDARHRLSVDRGMIAGLLLGGAVMTRIDALVFLVPTAAYLAYELVVADRGEPAERGPRRRLVAAVGGGALLTAGLGAVNGLAFSPPYIERHAFELGLVLAALVLTVLAGAGVVLGHRRADRVGRWLRRSREGLAWAGAGVVVAAAAYAAFVRPELREYLGPRHDWIEVMQEREGVPVDGRRRFTEMSFRWLVWYLGPVAVAGGVLGAAHAVRRALQGRAGTLLPFIGIVVAASAIYVWRPSVFPDHIWAMRRFVPVTVPGLLLLAFWGGARLWEAGWRRGVAAGVVRGAVVAAAAVTLAASAATLAPVPTARTQAGMLATMERLCGELPADAAVLVSHELHMQFMATQTVRGFCRVPTAATVEDVPAERYLELADDSHEQGYRLFLLAREPEPFGPGIPTEMREVAQLNHSFLERTVSRRPTGVQDERLPFFLGELRRATRP